MSDKFINDAHEAITTIAGEEGGAEAAGLLAGLMAQNARELESLTLSLYEGMERERDVWRERALEAERHIYAIERRLSALLAPPTRREEEQWTRP